MPMLSFYVPDDWMAALNAASGGNRSRFLRALLMFCLRNRGFSITKYRRYGKTDGQADISDRVSRGLRKAPGRVGKIGLTYSDSGHVGLGGEVVGWISAEGVLELEKPSLLKGDKRAVWRELLIKRQVLGNKGLEFTWPGYEIYSQLDAKDPRIG